MKIGTHSGTFHADEAMACFMLKLTNQFKDAEIVRSRDPKVLSALDILVDVGGEYDPKRHRYDHHQREFTETFDEKHDIKLSSAGLVYKHFGREVIRNVIPDQTPEALEMIFQRVYNNLIFAMDGIDNGVSQYPPDVRPRYRDSTDLSSRVGRLNSRWFENDDAGSVDAAFAKAMDVAGEELLHAIRDCALSWMPARKHVEEAVNGRFAVHPSGEIILLATFCPWKEHLGDLEDEQKLGTSIKYVLFEDTSKTWRVQAVPSREGSFQSRKPLPSPWRGLRDDHLSEVSGVPGCVFVHASGFIGGVKTKEGALALAAKALTLD